MPRPKTRSERIEARLTPESLEIVRRAAELQGRSLSDFVVLAAEEAAYKTIEETSIIRLSTKEQKEFADMLINPPKPTISMKKASEAHERLIQK